MDQMCIKVAFYMSPNENIRCQDLIRFLLNFNLTAYVFIINVVQLGQLFPTAFQMRNKGKSLVRISLKLLEFINLSMYEENCQYYNA